MTALYHDGCGGYLTQDQWDACRFSVSDYNVLIWTGSTRQGKTRGMVRSALMHASKTKPDEDEAFTGYALLGQTKETILRNIVPYFQLFARRAGEEMRPSHPTTSHGSFTLLGHRWYMFGGENPKTPDRIRGMSAQGFICDEAVLLPRDVIEEAFSRLSELDAKAWLATNKGGRRHWLRRDYIDLAPELVEHGIKIWNLDSEYGSNPFIDEKQSKLISATQSGVRKKRLIDNEWADVSGMIYGDDIPVWSDAEEIPAGHITSTPEIILSIDPGASNMFAAAILYKHRGEDGVNRLFGIDEYAHSPADDGDLTDAEHVEQLIKWLDVRGCNFREISTISDPENKPLRTALRQAGFQLVPVNKTVLDGIYTTQMRMKGGQLLFRASMIVCLDQLQGYTWDPNAADKGEDKPLKQNDHFCDLVRYAVMYALPPRSGALLGTPTEAETAETAASRVADKLRQLRG